MADGGGLENRYTERYRGFESYPLRQIVLSAKSEEVASARSPRRGIPLLNTTPPSKGVGYRLR